MPSPSRRAVLSAAGSALLAAGCLGLGGDATRTVSLEAVDGSRHDVSLSVTMLESNVTESHPAHLEVTVENDGDGRRISPSTDLCGPFAKRDGGSVPRGLWLNDPDRAASIDHPDGRWTRADGSRPRGFPDIGCAGRRYAAGERITSTYEVWDDYAAGGYYPEGTYRFETPVAVYPTESGAGEPAAEFEWGFTLRVED